MSNLMLYKLEASSPASSVLVLADILNLKLKSKDMDYVNMEHKTPEYLKINPLGTVPLLVDEDFHLTDRKHQMLTISVCGEDRHMTLITLQDLDGLRRSIILSHAMLTYLLSKYGGEQSERLYPSDIRTRALIDQAMFFDTGVYFIQVKRVALPSLYEGMTSVPDNIKKDIDAAYSVVEAFLKNGPYLAGEQYTIADISVGLTTAALQSIHILDKAKYPRIAAWLNRLRLIAPFKKYSESACNSLRDMLQTCWDKNSA